MYVVKVLLCGLWIECKIKYNSYKEAEEACQKASFAPDEYRITKEDKNGKKRTEVF